ncbi:hypothetical protein PC129_g22476 [Phytophthora cactorum]|uniref:Uncharacterized protein n=1 Tax=Phytophthora cactorum TaxID=29920 RepID=A0A8T1H2S3_9STRA|nr:hypothetical protein PC114_g25511 [Phytophthora cactorum]KAG2887426.1 hypothetical protein PC117_g25164 [Phytophthora cactorum]KAG2959522.1 hypothetical protein PC118_g22981 [Phytophthora cactorum]KAG3204681.1 hypothetical protein PC129_g22476 [Phytophthora cactorum]
MPSLYNRYSLQIKLRILEAARSDGDWELIAETNNVNISTARSWLRCYPKTSDVLQPRPRGGKRQHKMTADGVAYLLSELLIGPTIKNHLDGNLITMKQFHKEPQYMNTEVNKLKRREYLICLQELQAMGKSIIYMDETTSIWGRLVLRVTGLVSVIDREPVSPNRSNPNPRRLRHLWVQDCRYKMGIDVALSNWLK